MELLIAVDIMRTDKQGVHFNCTCNCDMVCGAVGCECTFSMCNAHKLKYERLTALWTSILCPKDEFSMWHKRKLSRLWPAVTAGVPLGVKL
jgi:hypothetical protein